VRFYAVVPRLNAVRSQGYFMHAHAFVRLERADESFPGMPLRPWNASEAWGDCLLAFRQNEASIRGQNTHAVGTGAMRID
jgi:hypothetical protein